MEELYPSEIQRKCKVSYVQSIAVKNLVKEQISQTLQEVRKEILGQMEVCTLENCTDQYLEHGARSSNSARVQALQVIDKHL